MAENPEGTATYYMVEMDYPHDTAAERDAFDAFYQRHIDMLLTIPGFLTAQRFHCAQAAGVPVRAPFLALYRLAGPGVMTSDGYTAISSRARPARDSRTSRWTWVGI